MNLSIVVLLTRVPLKAIISNALSALLILIAVGSLSRDVGSGISVGGTFPDLIN